MNSQKPAKLKSFVISKNDLARTNEPIIDKYSMGAEELVRAIDSK